LDSLNLAVHTKTSVGICKAGTVWHSVDITIPLANAAGMVPIVRTTWRFRRPYRSHLTQLFDLDINWLLKDAGAPIKTNETFSRLPFLIQRCNLAVAPVTGFEKTKQESLMCSLSNNVPPGTICRIA
jgi:hypothetical protein